MIGIIVAMNSEAELVKNIMQDCKEEKTSARAFYRGKIASKDIVLAVCGYGKVNAAISCTEMILRYSPSLIINTGVAGGVKIGIKQGDIVCASEVSYHDVWCGDGNKLGQVQDLPAKYKCQTEVLEKLKQKNLAKIGLVCSGDWFVTKTEEIERIRNNFPDALALDMESGAIAQCCHIYNVPFLASRLVSDTPGETDDHKGQWQGFWETAAKTSFSFLEQLLAAV